MGLGDRGKNQVKKGSPSGLFARTEPSITEIQNSSNTQIQNSINTGIQEPLPEKNDQRKMYNISRSLSERLRKYAFDERRKEVDIVREALSLMNEKQSLSHFKGRSLCWKASRRYFPRRRKHSAKKKLSVVFMRCSANMETDFPNHSQHCCPGLLMV